MGCVSMHIGKIQIVFGKLRSQTNPLWDLSVLFSIPSVSPVCLILQAAAKFKLDEVNKH